MKDLTIDRKLYRQFNTAYIYVSTHNRTHCHSLIDWGDNGEVSGGDVTVINTSSQRHVNIRRIENHEITSVPIATGGALDHSQSDSVTIIMYQCEYNGKGETIHASVQLEWYNNDVGYKSSKVNGV